MSLQSPLLIIVAEARDERLWAALQTAIAARAQGRAVFLFLSGPAAEMGLRRWHAPGDSKRHAYCIDTVHDLLDRSTMAGVRFHACRTGLHLLEESEDALSLLFAPAALDEVMQQVPGAQWLAF